MFDALAASPSGFDSALYIYFLARRCMVQLDNFGPNGRATAIRHDQTVEPKNHAGMAAQFAGYVDMRDVTVDSGILVFAFVYNSRTEWVSNLGIRAGQCVVKANAEGHVIWNSEVLRRRC